MINIIDIAKEKSYTMGLAFYLASEGPVKGAGPFLFPPISPFSAKAVQLAGCQELARDLIDQTERNSIETLNGFMASN